MWAGMECLLNQSYISQSPWDIRKDLLQQLHWLITRRREGGSVWELQSVKGRKEIKFKGDRANKGGKSETTWKQIKKRKKEKSLKDKDDERGTLSHLKHLSLNVMEAQSPNTQRPIVQTHKPAVCFWQNKWVTHSLHEDFSVVFAI